MPDVVIPFAEIPSDVYDRVERRLRDYWIPIVASSQHGERRVTLAGSGTLAFYGSIRGILTAAHVWDAASKFECLHLLLSERYTNYLLPTKDIQALVCRDVTFSEWGPDLCFIALDDEHASRIAASKSFVNLQQQQDQLAAAAPVEDGFWAVTGMVGEQSIIVPADADGAGVSVLGRAFYSSLDRRHERGDWDYYDVGADCAVRDVPATFGGLSGGGLWEIRLMHGGPGVFEWDGLPKFRGVVFWETPLADRLRSIRCHGPKSVLDRIWKSWGLSR